MSLSVTGLTFVWLLQLTACRAQTSVSTPAATEQVEEKTMTTHRRPDVKTHPADSAHVFSLSTTAGVNVPREAPTSTLTTFLPHTPTAATESISPQINTSAARRELTTGLTLRTEATTVSSSQTSNPTTTTTTTTTASLYPSSLTPSQNSGMESTVQSTAHLSTHPAETTHLVSNISTQLPGDKSMSTSRSPVRTGPTSTKNTPMIHTTRAKRSEDPSKITPDYNTDSNHGKAVAGLIGGALVAMMIGFLVIFIKKQKLQKQQITTTDWAGPSPFLESGAENGQVIHRSSNRISLSSFLPQRLSKRLSLLPETEEELQDMAPGTTFGDKHQGGTFGQEADTIVVPETNGTSVGEIKSSGDSPETENSPQTDILLSNDNSDAANLSQDSASSPAVSETVVESNGDPK